jgi:hypothetical protein
VLRIAGQLITNATCERFVAQFQEHGVAALPRVLDLLNCTGLTDEGMASFLAINDEERAQCRLDQRPFEFAITGLRVQEVRLPRQVQG